MNLSRCLLPALVLFALAPTASADRFYFGSEDAENMVEGEPDYIEGVLLKEEDGFYVIRIEGGELRVPKASVRKIEKDDLVTATIEEREADAATYLAEANALRSQMLAAEADARRERVRESIAVEASARREVEPAPLPVAGPGWLYDPVLHISYPEGANANQIQTELGGLIRRKLQKRTREQVRRL